MYNEKRTNDYAFKKAKEYDANPHSVSYGQVFMDGYMTAIKETDPEVQSLQDRIKEMERVLMIADKFFSDAPMTHSERVQLSGSITNVLQSK